MESELTRPNRDEMPAGSALLDHRLFLAHVWGGHPKALSY